MPSNNLLYYMQAVQRESGLSVSASFPTAPSDQEQRVLDRINEALRYLNTKYYLAFMWTEYILTTVSGTSSYNLQNAPYNISEWRVNRMARNGVIRYTDDYILDYIDYSSLDEYRPHKQQVTKALIYSSTGTNLILYPQPSGEQYRIRYYGTHIGTDSTGVTLKTRLSVGTDLPMIQDEYEDALVSMAVSKVRLKDGVDAKYNEYKKKAEDWEKILYDMSGPGEDAEPQMIVRPFGFYSDDLYARYFPFGTRWE
jgi:hypothetical protein